VNCHRGEPQLWRRSPNGAGGSTISIVTDLWASKCMDASSPANGTQLHLWECQGPSHTNQRFTRTTDKHLQVHAKCVDGGAGTAGAPVKVEDCNPTRASQTWDLLTTGQLRGVNGLCVAVSGAGTTNGTKLVLASCINTAAQRWDYRDPIGDIGLPE